MAFRLYSLESRRVLTLSLPPCCQKEMSPSCLYLTEGHVVTSSCLLSINTDTVGKLLQSKKDVDASLNASKATNQIPGEGESDWLPPPAYKAEDPASAGVSHPPDGLPANLPEGEDGRQDRAALQGCHTPRSYSAFLRLCFIFQTSFRQSIKTITLRLVVY